MNYKGLAGLGFSLKGMHAYVQLVSYWKMLLLIKLKLIESDVSTLPGFKTDFLAHFSSNRKIDCRIVFIELVYET